MRTKCKANRLKTPQIPDKIDGNTFERAVIVSLGLAKNRCDNKGMAGYPPWPEPPPVYPLDRERLLAPESEPAPTDRPTDRRKRRARRLGGGAAGLGTLLAKFAGTAKAALFALGNIKVLATAGTAAVSVAAYSLYFGWPLAVGFVILLFIHEMGHVIQLRREGVEASPPLFIPLLGAFISAKSLGEDAAAEARVGLAGPVLGSAASAAVAIAGFFLHSDLLKALAYLGFFLNLFNLLPVVPLDGGRAMAAMSPWMWFAGFGLLLALLFAAPNPVLLLIAVLAGVELYRRWQARNRALPAARAYYSVPPRTRLAIGATYLGLVALLVLGMAATRITESGGHLLTRL